MIEKKLVNLPSWLSFAAASIVLLPVSSALGQTAPAKAPVAATPPAAKAPAADASAQDQNRSVAYYHLALANIYEDEALENGNTDAARLAVDEYKNALNADPNSPPLNDELPPLPFRPGA